MSSPSMASPSRQVPSPLNLPSRDRCSPSASEFTARAHTPSSSSGRRQDPQQASSFVNHSRRMHPISSLRPVRAEQFKDWNGTGPQQDHIQCSFEWPIYDLRALKVHVQDNAAGLRSTGAEMSSPLELPEALRNGVVIGDGYYKLDIARTIPYTHTPKSIISEMVPLPGEETPILNTLSLYIHALTMEWQNYTGPVSADISVGIKSIGRSIGSRYAAMDWAWTRSATFEFNIENDYWEVELPLLSTLIERADLAEADSFSLCVQIGTPICSKPTFQFPHQLIVQTSMTDSLAGLIDSTTGDVRFVCLEHSAAPLSPMDDEGISGRTLSKIRTLSRKRILYAHSDVLKARGEYFAALLMGGFSESEIKRRGDSKHTTILVDDADFETVYWVLKFIYTYQITFADDDNVRLLTDRCHLNNGEVAKMLGSAPAYLGENEWDYRRLPTIEEEPEDNVSDFEHDGKTTKMFSEPDPHHHPTTAPGPGSALAIFKLSHRYRIEVLQNLAMEHILSRLTPGNCMPLLLATYRYEDFYYEVQKYVCHHMQEIQSQPEFLRCITEIAAGVWGELGGLVLLGLFQRI